MIRRAATLALTSCATAIAIAAQGSTSPQQPTFRVGVDAVIVDVVVRDGGRPVTGLRAENFVLTDNGVRQQVDTVDATSVPVDLTMIVDVSGSPRSPWQDPPSAEKTIASLNREMQGVAQALRPDDRLRLLAVDRQVVRVLPFRTRAELMPITQLPFNGLPSLFDSLAAALIHATEPARRHVIVARTKGVDTFSVLDATAIKALAERSDALLHISVMEDALDNDAALSAFQCQFIGLCWASTNFWVPQQRRLVGGRPRHPLLPDGELIAAAADATGGSLHQAQLLTTPSLTDVFRRTMEEYRNSYVLRYTPRGVTAAGWHAIDVKVPGKNYRVRARPGYFIEAPGYDPARASNPTTVLGATTPATLSDLVAAYDRRDYTAVATAVRANRDPLKQLRDFEALGNPWPAAPRREAALVLELLEPALFSTDDSRKGAIEVLDRYSRLIRPPFGPDIFERYWYFAAITMVEGTLQPAVLETLVARARERFPDEPRFMLSEAIAAEQRSLGRSSERARVPADDQADRVRRLFEAAIAHPETAAEARIRLAWYLHRSGKHQEALDLLDVDVADRSGDTTLPYLRLLFRGHVLTALKRPDAALDAFADASAVIPTAQSARVAMMNARLLAGARAEAEALAERIQRDTQVSFDPWWTYWQGQYRFQSQAMNRVRELAR